MEVKAEYLNDCLKISHTYGPDSIFEYLCMSDTHTDNKKSKRDTTRYFLDNAVSRNAYILLFGDINDLMGMKFDPRSAKGDIDPLVAKNDYTMQVAEMAADFFAPYADRILHLSIGNHEYQFNRRQETDIYKLTDLFLSQKYGKRLRYINNYEGWIWFCFENQSGGSRSSFRLYYTHGSGGNSPATGGVLKNDRRAANIDADIYVSGHLHQPWSVPRTKKYLSMSGTEVVKERLHLQLGATKELGSWEKMKEFAEGNVSYYYLKFYARNKTIDFIEERIKA